MPTFEPIDRRLVLRYREGRAFSFCKVRNDADNQGMLNLANAIASIQDEAPRKITTVLTQRLF